MALDITRVVYFVGREASAQAVKLLLKESSVLLRVLAQVMRLEALIASSAGTGFQAAAAFTGASWVLPVKSLAECFADAAEFHPLSAVTPQSHTLLLRLGTAARLYASGTILPILPVRVLALAVCVHARRRIRNARTCFRSAVRIAAAEAALRRKASPEPSTLRSPPQPPQPSTSSSSRAAAGVPELPLRFRAASLAVDVICLIPELIAGTIEYALGSSRVLIESPETGFPQLRSFLVGLAVPLATLRVADGTALGAVDVRGASLWRQSLMCAEGSTALLASFFGVAVLRWVVEPRAYLLVAAVLLQLVRIRNYALSIAVTTSAKRRQQRRAAVSHDTGTASPPLTARSASASTAENGAPHYRASAALYGARTPRGAPRSERSHSRPRSGAGADATSRPQPSGGHAAATATTSSSDGDPPTAAAAAAAPPDGVSVFDRAVASACARAAMLPLHAVADWLLLRAVRQAGELTLGEQHLAFTWVREDIAGGLGGLLSGVAEPERVLRWATGLPLNTSVLKWHVLSIAFETAINWLLL